MTRPFLKISTLNPGHIYRNQTSKFYSFGSLIKDRVWSPTSTDNYRFGFNGKEKDDETGTQDYGLRIYNPSLGRFLSIDPLEKKFAWNSPYSFAENRVVDGVDLEGKEWIRTVTVKKRLFRPDITIISYTVIAKVVDKTNLAGQGKSAITQEELNKILSLTSTEMAATMNNANKTKNLKYQFKILGTLVNADEVKPTDFVINLLQGPDKFRSKIMEGETNTTKGGNTLVGETQINTINLNICYRFEGEMIVGVRNEMDLDDVITTLKHELGHTAGLYHVFEEESGLKDRYEKGMLDRNLLSYPSKAVQTINQEDYCRDENNRVVPMRCEDLLPEQMETIDKTVKSQQPRKK
jgi:RHS repeat-associated protein